MARPERAGDSHQKSGMTEAKVVYLVFLYMLFLQLICPSPQDDVIEDSMVVEPRHHRHFVCRRGQVLRELAEEYGGVAVSFPRTGTHSDSVTLKGPRECVDAAKKRIQEIVRDLVSF